MPAAAAAAIPSPAPVAPAPAAAAPAAARPVLPPDIPEFFLRPRRVEEGVTYRAGVLGVCKLHFADAKAGVDTWLTYTLAAPLGEDGFALWEEAEVCNDLPNRLDPAPVAGAAFAALPSAATRKPAVESWQKTLAAHAYQNIVLNLASCPGLKLTAVPGESEGDFNTRVAQALREARDAEVDKLRARYAPKLQALGDQIRRAEERVEREKSQVGQQKLSTALNVGATLLGAFFGRRTASVGTILRAGSAARSAGRWGKESSDVTRANESAAVLRERLAALEQQFQQDSAAVQGRCEPGAAGIVQTPVRPRKSDIAIGRVGLLWRPWRAGADGLAEPA